MYAKAVSILAEIASHPLFFAFPAFKATYIITLALVVVWLAIMKIMSTFCVFCAIQDARNAMDHQAIVYLAQAHTFIIIQVAL